MNILGQNDVLLSIADLIKMNNQIGVKRDSINVSISRYNTGKSLAWSTIPDPQDGRQCLIHYSTIPDTFKRKYNLPTVQDLIKQIKLNSKADKLVLKQNANFLKQLPIQAAFEKAAEKGYVKFCPVYHKVFPNDNVKVVQLAIKHAIADACVKLTEQQPKVSIKAIHEVYKALPYDWLITDYTRFTAKFKEWQGGNVNMLHGAQGGRKDDKPHHNLKLTDAHIGFLEEAARHPAQLGHEMIAKLVNRNITEINQLNGNNELKHISAASVSKYMNIRYNKNSISADRNKEYFNKTVMPTIRRKEVQFAGDLYYADGSPLNITCLNEEGTKLVRLNLFVVMDVMSGKIVGYDLALNEDRYNWLAAIKMAFTIEGLAPFEIKYDNASATKTDEFNELKSKMLLKGCDFTPAKKGNPKEKSQVERWFETFQSKYLRMLDGFMGEGIRSQRENGRINADHVAKMQRVENRYTYDTMQVRIAELIGMYNATKRRTKPSPNEMYKTSIKQNANYLAAHDMPFLFWMSKEIAVRGSIIKTEVQKTPYEFKVYDNTIAMAVNGGKVRMYYDPADMTTVQLFTIDGQYLTECKQVTKQHEGKAGQTDADILSLVKEAKHNEAILTVVKKHTDDIAAKAVAVLPDSFVAMLNPMTLSKEEVQSGELDEFLNYAFEYKGIDPTKVKELDPVHKGRIFSQANDKAHQRPTQLKDNNPSLAVVTKGE